MPKRINKKLTTPRDKHLRTARQKSDSSGALVPNQLYQLIRLHFDQERMISPYSQHVWIYACVNSIASNISSIPFKFYTGDENEKKLIEQTHPLPALFRQPNPLMPSATELLFATMAFLSLDGECLWVLEYKKEKPNLTDIPSEIWARSPRGARAIIKNDLIDEWEFQNENNKRFILPSWRVIHFKYFNPYSTYRGLSPLMAQRMIIDQDWRLNQYNLAWLDNAGDPGGLLTTEQDLTEDQAKGNLRKWNDRHQGASKAGRTALLTHGIKYQQLQISHHEMQFLEQFKWNRDSILAAYKVPKREVAIYEDTNYATARSEDKGYWQKTLIPKMKLIENTLDGTLFRRIFGDAFWGEFDLSVIESLREEFNLLVETAGKLFNMGVPFNKINEKLNLGFEALPHGNIGFLPFSLVPASSAIADAKQAASTEDDKSLSAERLENRALKFWENYIKGHIDPFENRFQKRLSRYFMELRVEQLKLLQEHFGENVKEEDIPRILFDEQKWKETLKHELRPIYFDITVAAGAQIVNETGGLFQFDALNPRVVRIMETQLIKVTKVTETVRKNLGASIAEGIKASETIDEIARRIRDEFNFSQERSTMIARTEVGAATNQARFEAMKQGGIEFHRWLSAGDERVRQPPQSEYNHAIDGETVALGQRFTNGLTIPNDPEGAPGNVINCRCVTLAAIEK